MEENEKKAEYENVRVDCQYTPLPGAEGMWIVFLTIVDEVTGETLSSESFVAEAETETELKDKVVEMIAEVSGKDVQVTDETILDGQNADTAKGIN